MASKKQKTKIAKPPAAKDLPAKVKLSWLPQRTFELEFTVPWKKVKQTYGQILKKAAAKTIIKGFRKGRAPLKLVEQTLDKQKLYQEVLKKLLPETYEAAVKKHHLVPIISPRIEVISLKEEEDWKFKATSCEKPAIKLGNYQQIVKGELAKSKIWTPGKDKGLPKAGKKDEEEKSDDEKLKIVTQTLLNNIEVEIADMLIEDEVNRMLTKLLDQINSLGMTIEQYLASRGINNQQLRLDYQKQAQTTLKLEFILQAIIEERKIKVDPQEIDKMIKAVPDEKSRQRLENPFQRAYIASILAKRKVLDYLISL